MAFGTRYYYRAVGTGDNGTGYDSIRTFVVAAEAPVVSAAFHEAPVDDPDWWVPLFPSYRTHIEWTQPGMAAHSYRIQRRTAGHAGWAQLAERPGQDRGFTDVSFPIVSARQYEYRVLACRESGECAASAPVAVTTVGMPAPANLTGAQTPEGRVLLGWGDLPHEQEFIVQWRADSTAAWQTLVTTARSRISYTATWVKPGATNYYRVAGMSSGFRTGTWANVSVLAAWTMAAQTGAAAALSPSTAALNATVIASGLPANAWFEWGTSPTLATFSSTPASPVPGSSVVSDTITVPAPGTYYYRVAVSNGVHSGRSHIRSVAVGLPAAPVLAVLFRTWEYVTHLSWTHSGEGNPASFRIYRNSGLLREVSSATRSFTDMQVPVNVPGLTHHTYHVAACNAANQCTGVGSWVEVAPMPAPQGLTATRLADGRVQVQWQDLAGYQQYLVQWRTSASAVWQTLVSTGANSTAYTTSSFNASATNYYRVSGLAVGNRPGLFREVSLVVP